MMRKTRMLQKENNRLDEQILEENQEKFTDMICYLRGSDLTDYDVESVRHDLTEMVLAAQERGEGIDAVIGEDYKEFCDSVIETLPKKTPKQKLVEKLDMICLCLSILFAINIVLSRDTIEMIKNAIVGGQVNLNIAISAWTALSIVVIILVANLIVNTIVKNAMEKEKMQKRGAEIAGVIVVTLLLFVFAWVGKGTLFTVNIFVACAVTVALFGLHKGLENIV
ncbi:MAG: hypothetical protein MRZ75_12360 [Roseburia sp.]|uniref:hypothetical protein n=1 Tax=Roseburia sp. 831b TaxID=1261635 RepID=UPI000952DB27|nr:hypothetical protein [Roseburia sp. 831b]MCI5920100.1 hypothetical protein [Roseburia sp.]MDD6216452.1 hypothetical protein [Roseburia sp.]MDY5882345.1 hypothetical protein [Roseburia sp.]WVK72668.1 hypothetical protein BIV16_13140 [Roseburia sp. 831b]